MFRSNHNDTEKIEQYHQIGIEAFGYPDIDIELEHILLQHHFFSLLSLTPYIELKINNLGSSNEFSQFRSALQHYFTPFASLLSHQQRSQLETIPEKLLSITTPIFRPLLDSAPMLQSFLSPASVERFTSLTNALRMMEIPFTIDRHLFPIHNYCYSVTEWHTDLLPEQTICRGGRYDTSASRTIGRQIYACGFAFMLEPILQLSQLTTHYFAKNKLPDVVIIPKTQRSILRSLMLSHQLRDAFPQLNIMNDFSNMNLGSSKKNAIKKGIKFILLVPAEQEGAIELTEGQKIWGEEVDLNKIIQQISRSLNNS